MHFESSAKKCRPYLSRVAAMEALESRRLLSGNAPAEMVLNMSGPDNINRNVMSVAQVGDTVFANTKRQAEAEELYVGNGTQPATLIFTAAGIDGPGYGIASLTAYNEKLFFLADGGPGEPSGLYEVNRTIAGTNFITNGGIGGTPLLGSNSFQIGDNFYFFMGGSPNLTHLFASDGTAAGTVSIWTGPASGVMPIPSQPIGGYSFFSSSGAVWRTDGTPAGTTEVWSGTSQSAIADHFMLAGKKLYFTYEQTFLAPEFHRLYVADPDGSNPAQVPIPSTGAEAEVMGSPVPVGNHLVFSAATSVFSTDGTPQGTIKISRLVPGDPPYPYVVARAGGNAVFVENSDDPSLGGLWTTDGTLAGTHRILATGPFRDYQLFSADGEAFLHTEYGFGLRLIRSNGTSEGTQPIDYLAPGHAFEARQVALVADTGARFQLAGDGSGIDEIWSFDPHMLTGSINGTAFSDLNQDGVPQLFEPRVAGTAYIDLNNSGQLDRDDAPLDELDIGTFVLNGLPPGPYLIRYCSDSGVIPIQPASGTFSIDLQADQVATADFIYSVAPGAVVWGTVFNDENADGLRDPAEAPLQGQIVYLDLNRDGLRESDEPFRLTSMDGTYGFAGEAPGSYLVRRTDSSGWIQTVPPGRNGRTLVVGPNAIDEADFGLTPAATGTITGALWNDLNRDGQHQPNEYPLIARVYLDSNQDGHYSAGLEPTALSDSDGHFSLENVLPGPEVVGFLADDQLVQTSPVDDGELNVTVPIGGTANAGEFLAYMRPAWLRPDPEAVWSLTSNTLHISAGTVHIADASTSDPDLNVVVSDGATLILDANQHLGLLTIELGGHVDESTYAMALGYVDGEAGPPPSWNGTRYDGIAGQIQDGAIFSSHAVRHSTTVAVAQAFEVLGISVDQTAVWDGHLVNGFSTLIKFTYAGDANLDGKINIDDYGRIDANVGQSGTVFGWYNGDFNFDGKINIDDYGLIDSVIGSQGPVL